MKKMISMALALLFSLVAFAQTEVSDTLGFDKSVAKTPADLLNMVAGMRSESDGSVAGSEVQVYIRGLNSMRDDTQPLWIVDGAIVDASISSLSWLNPDDIKSITVLKDLSALALYGSQGANGVILIETGLTDTKKDFTAVWNSDLGAYPKFGQKHSVSLSGATGKTSYGVSGFYRGLNGAKEGNTLSEGGARISFETAPGKFFQFGTSAAFSIGDDYNADVCDYQHKNKGGEASLYALFNFTPSLKLKINGGFDLRNGVEYKWYGENTAIGSAENGYGSIVGKVLSKYNVAADLSWYRYFAKDHAVKASATFDLNSDDVKYSSMAGSDFFTYSLGAKGMSLAEGKADVAKYNNTRLALGGCFYLGYSWKEILGIDAALRLDSTPRYDDKVRLGKSGNVFFDIHNAFFRDSKNFSCLRLTAGYGEAWKDQVIPGAYFDVKEGTEPFYEGLTRIHSAEFNAGVRMGFISDRFTLDLKYYDKRTTDNYYGWCFGALAESGYWEYTARTEFFKRSSLLSNRGFELNLGADIVRSKPFTWYLAANAAWNVNQALKVDLADENLAVLGQSLGVSTGYRTAPDGTPLDITGDGVVDMYDMVILGDSLPAVTGALSSTMNIFGVYLDVLATGVQGLGVRCNRVSLGYNLAFKPKDTVKCLKFRINGLPLWRGFTAGVGIEF